MRTIYLKQTGEWPLNGNNYHYKVTETPDGCTTVNVTKDSISVDYDEDFFEQVGFIRKTLCEGRSKEITRMEFDTNYIKTVHKINDAMNLATKSLEDDMKEWADGFDNRLKDLINNFE